MPSYVHQIASHSQGFYNGGPVTVISATRMRIALKTHRNAEVISCVADRTCQLTMHNCAQEIGAAVPDFVERLLATPSTKHVRFAMSVAKTNRSAELHCAFRRA